MHSASDTAPEPHEDSVYEKGNMNSSRGRTFMQGYAPVKPLTTRNRAAKLNPVLFKANKLDGAKTSYIGKRNLQY